MYSRFKQQGGVDVYVNRAAWEYARAHRGNSLVYTDVHFRGGAVVTVEGQAETVARELGGYFDE